MEKELPPCTKCGSTYTYQEGVMYLCPECTHEWTTIDKEEKELVFQVRDAYGNLLQDGDDITVIKDLKLKGGSVIKVGSKAKDIRLTEGSDGHNIDCKIKGHGAIMLKS